MTHAARHSSTFLRDFLQYDLRAPHARADWIGLRHVAERTTARFVRNEKPERNTSQIDEGVMIEVLVRGRSGGHLGYAGTSDLSPSGLRRALERAIESTHASAAHAAHGFTSDVRPLARGQYSSPSTIALDTLSVGELADRMIGASRTMHASEHIVTRAVQAITVQTHTQALSTSGSDATHDLSMAYLQMSATAQDGAESQTRSSVLSAHQSGAEGFARELMLENGERLGREALELLRAPNCPSGTMDLLALADQMDLQIHESIGHPLELDRILGDERNYAGWSFVRPEDFGTLQYGSPLMNVTFDPGDHSQLASYAFDDGGHEAKREYLIRDGQLLRGLGGLESQRRLQLPGVANFRAASWNRAPIDRMANINLEPGTDSLDDLLAKVERGVLMSTNRSWSIDDYRRKFQFGCEYGRVIENGRLGAVVKNPNYRGVTVPFWNTLVGVGDTSLRRTQGVMNCGKGEPNQVIRVSHATPPCLFKNIEIFGG